MRVSLLSTSSTEQIFLVVVHHIAVDLWSLTILLDELRTIYQARLSGFSPALPPLRSPYTDYVNWQSQMLQEPRGKKLQNYWQNKLAGELPVLNLPTDRPRPPMQTFAGSSHTFELDREITAGLRTLAKAEGASLYMVLLAGLQVLLYRYSGQEEIFVGSAAACRNGREFAGVVGACINPIVLRGDLTGNPSFTTLLARVRETVFEALQHQEYPFQLLIENIQVAPDLSRSPLFQVMFLLQKLHRGEDFSEFIVPSAAETTIDFGGLSLQPFPLAHQEGQFDLMLEAIETEGTLKCILKYNPLLFDSGTIIRTIVHFRTLLTGIIDNPQQEIDFLPLLTPTERDRLLIDWNDTATDYPRNCCIHELFEERVEETPDAIALVYRDRELTYQQLNTKANRLARYLQDLGVETEVLVGICLDRSLEIIIGLLAILKAGGVYLPLDPSYPPERIEFMLEEAGVKVVLTQTSLATELSIDFAELICLDREEKSIDLFSDSNLKDEIKSDNLAYVTYTSGSTGKPKGVCVTHRGVVRLVTNTKYAKFDSEQVFLQLAPISFDAATLEIWGCLLHGAKLILYPDRNPYLETLGRTIERHQISFLWLTAALFNLIVDENIQALQPVRQLLAGGDVLSIRHVRKVLTTLENCQLINGYGPTENTTFTCCYPIREIAENSTSISIGKPISNTQVYILDKHLQPLPIGVPGELYIGGDGLARGYLNRSDLTEEKFIISPFNHAEKLYKTGDLVRYLCDGNIEFLGRIDNQVKIRGFRLELGEIEVVLSQHPEVKDVTVIVRENTSGEKYLVAYLITKTKLVPTIQNLNSFLAQKLPKYMIPSRYLFLEAFPLSPNGKIQSQSLPIPNFNRSSVASPEIEPRNEIERQLIQIWQKVLNVPAIGIKDDFFDLGGNSLLTIRLIAEIEKSFSQKIPVTTFLELSTIDKLAIAINPTINSNNSSSTDTSEFDLDTDLSLEDFPQLTLQEKDMLLASTITKKRALGDRSLIMLEQSGNPDRNYPLFFVYLLGDLGKYFPPQQPVYNLTVWTKVERSETFIRAIAAYYIKEIRTIQPEGPYYIAGYCVGGSIALEIARQLQLQGQIVAHLSLIQTTSTNANYQRYQRMLFKFGYGYWLRLKIEWREIKRINNLLDRIDYLKTKLPKTLTKLKLKFGLSIDRSELPQKSNEIDCSIRETEVLNSLKKSMEYYRPEPYFGDVTLFFATEGTLVSFLFPDGGWGKLLTGKVNIKKIPGNHTGIIKDPQASILVKQFILPNQNKLSRT
jgi:amino acid adenylation domain-containing protein